MLSTRSVELLSSAARYKLRVALRQAQHHGLWTVALRLSAQRLPPRLLVPLHYCRRTFFLFFSTHAHTLMLSRHRVFFFKIRDLHFTFYLYLTRHIIPFEDLPYLKQMEPAK
jgi:hypothetical protein